MTKDFLHAVHDGKVYGTSECLESSVCHGCGTKLKWHRDVPEVRTYAAWCEDCDIAYHAYPQSLIVRASDQR